MKWPIIGHYESSPMLINYLNNFVPDSLFHGWSQWDRGYINSPSSLLSYRLTFSRYMGRTTGEVNADLYNGFAVLEMFLSRFVCEKDTLCSYEDVCQRLNLSASAGIGFPGVKRDAVYKHPDIYYQSLSWLRSIVLSGDFQRQLFRLFPKVELLKAAKELLRERGIACCPLMLQVVSIVLLSNMFSQLMFCCERSPIKVGLSNFYGGLRRLFLEHGKFSYHYSVDVSGLEDSFTPPVHQALGRLQGRLSHTNRFRQKMVECIHRMFSQWTAVNLSGDAMEVDGTEPSGSSTTVWDNSMYVCAAFFSYFLKEGFSVRQILEMDIYALAILGDDALLSLPYSIDIVEFQTYMLTFNLVFKLECDSRNLEDHEFLGVAVRGGKIVTGRVGKMLNNLLTCGFDPEKNYEVACGIRDVLFHHDEFNLIDRFCSYLESRFCLENKRTPLVVLEAMYAQVS